MKSRKQICSVKAVQDLVANTKIKMRRNLNADAMFKAIQQDFRKVAGYRADNSKMPLVDILMSGLAMFSLKDPSLLAFYKRRCSEPESLHGIYRIDIIPCDSQMRAALNPISPALLRQPFLTLFHHAQHGKVLEKMKWRDDYSDFNMLPTP